VTLAYFWDVTVTLVSYFWDVSHGVSQSFIRSECLHLQSHAVKDLFLDFIPGEQNLGTH